MARVTDRRPSSLNRLAEPVRTLPDPTPTGHLAMSGCIVPFKTRSPSQGIKHYPVAAIGAAFVEAAERVDGLGRYNPVAEGGEL